MAGGLPLGPVPDALATARVLDGAGAPVVLGDVWKDGPALLVFVRHFGCIGCSLQVVDLAPRLHEIAAVGVRTVIIGNSPVERVDGFVDRFNLRDKKLVVLTDPTLAAYAAAGLPRTWWGVLGLRALLDYAQGFGQGHGNQMFTGDDAQQGGAVLVWRGRVCWSRANTRVGDITPAVDIVDAVLREAARGVP